jgi:hypothetical protein
MLAQAGKVVQGGAEHVQRHQQHRRRLRKAPFSVAGAGTVVDMVALKAVLMEPLEEPRAGLDKLAALLKALPCVQMLALGASIWAANTPRTDLTQEILPEVLYRWALTVSIGQRISRIRYRRTSDGPTLLRSVFLHDPRDKPVASFAAIVDRAAKRRYLGGKIVFLDRHVRAKQHQRSRFWRRPRHAVEGGDTGFRQHVIRGESASILDYSSNRRVLSVSICAACSARTLVIGASGRQISVAASPRLRLPKRKSGAGSWAESEREFRGAVDRIGVDLAPDPKHGGRVVRREG